MDCQTKTLSLKRERQVSRTRTSKTFKFLGAIRRYCRSQPPPVTRRRIPIGRRKPLGRRIATCMSTSKWTWRRYRSLPYIAAMAERSPSWQEPLSMKSSRTASYVKGGKSAEDKPYSSCNCGKLRGGDRHLPSRRYPRVKMTPTPSSSDVNGNGARHLPLEEYVKKRVTQRPRLRQPGAVKIRLPPLGSVSPS
jgi:hypothetical protein